MCFESIFFQCLLCTRGSPGGPETLLVEMHAHAHRKTSTEAPCKGDSLHPLLGNDSRHKLCHLNDRGFSEIRNWGAMLLSIRILRDVYQTTQASYSP